LGIGIGIERPELAVLGDFVIGDLLQRGIALTAPLGVGFGLVPGFDVAGVIELPLLQRLAFFTAVDLSGHDHPQAMGSNG